VSTTICDAFEEKIELIKLIESAGEHSGFQPPNTV
jgi:hypothetical protein